MPYRYGRIKPAMVSLHRMAAFAALSAQLPEPPAAIDYTGGGAIYAGTLGNDYAGDCTKAGAYHLMQGWSAVVTPQSPFLATPELAIAAYSAATGYDPRTGANDTGCDETRVLDDWEANGLDLGDGRVNKLTSWSQLNPQNLTHIKQTIWCFGGTYLGLSMPQSAESQTDAGQPWSRPWFSPIVGGHCVVSAKYDEQYLYVSTWGREQPVEWSFVLYYFDAAYAVLDPLWLGPDGKSPGGLDVAALTADLSAVAN